MKRPQQLKGTGQALHQPLVSFTQRDPSYFNALVQTAIKEVGEGRSPIWKSAVSSHQSLEQSIGKYALYRIRQNHREILYLHISYAGFLVLAHEF